MQMFDSQGNEESASNAIISITMCCRNNCMPGACCTANERCMDS